MVKCQKILMVASGFSSSLINEYDYVGNGWTIVAINHGWMATKDWTYWVKSSDFKGQIPQLSDHQVKVRDYVASLKEFGGHSQCGYSITLCASYWVLANLSPNVIGYLGADMNYTPNNQGHTHIYGKGLDIIKHGIPDPDRMVKQHSKGDPEFLTKIYKRFEQQADSRNCKVYNFSNDQNTRLPYNTSNPSHH